MKEKYLKQPMYSPLTSKNLKLRSNVKNNNLFSRLVAKIKEI